MAKIKWTITVVLLSMISTVILIDVMFQVGAFKWMISYTTLYTFFIGTPLTMQHYLARLFKNEVEPMW